MSSKPHSDYLEVRTDQSVERRLLGDGEVTLGRASDCIVVLLSDAVSRHHARVFRDGGQRLIEDLGSLNGTLVNGNRITQATVLADGDVIGISDREIVFRSPGNADKPALAVQMDGVCDPTIVSTIDVLPEATRDCELDPQVVLRSVLEVTRQLGQRLELDRLLPRVLETLFDLYPQTDQGVVLLVEPTSGELESRAIKSRSQSELRVSRTVVRQAMERKQAILSSDASADSQFDSSVSLMQMPIRSLMCVPLIGYGDEALGVIELHSSEQGQYTPG